MPPPPPSGMPSTRPMPLLDDRQQSRHLVVVLDSRWRVGASTSVGTVDATLRLLVGGGSAKEIARLLDISHRTVEYHKYQAMEILGARSSAELLKHNGSSPRMRSASSRVTRRSVSQILHAAPADSGSPHGSSR